MASRKLSLNITTIIGVVLAIGTFLLTLTFLSTNEEKVTIYVASQDIGATKMVTPNMVEARSIPEDAVPQGALLNPSFIVDRYALDDIYAGETFTERRVAAENQSSTAILTESLEPGTRLISVQADVAAAIAGRIKTGDIVDVIAVLTAQNSSTNTNDLDGPPVGSPVDQSAEPEGSFAQTIVQQARVIDVNLPQDALRQNAESGVNPAESGASPVYPGIYTLAVTAKQAEILALADNNGTLYLTLTPPNATPVEGDPSDISKTYEVGDLAPVINLNRDIAGE